MSPRTLLFVALVAAVAALAAAYAAEPVFNDDVINAVNRDATSTWVAGRNDRFEHVSRADARRMLGAKLRPARLPKRIVEVDEASIPTSFDARTQWPNCIHGILDQGQCGSCWAFGATEALSDRLCIGSSGKTSVVLSPQDLVSCDSENYGCNGGYLDAAWNYMKSTGVVTLQCEPYVSGQSGAVPSCAKHCTGQGTFTKYHAASSYDVGSTVSAIQTEIMTNGPVEAAFEVYQDFFAYKGGVYQHKSGSLDGGHAIKIIGWGVENNTPYWLIANSWGTSWGMSGFFKILRGQDECGIESNIVAGKPQVSSAGSPVHPSPVDDLEAPALDDALIDAVNRNPASTWKAARNTRFQHHSRREARRSLGAKTDRLPGTAPIVKHAASVPDSFDSRTQWPGCVHPIRDQEQCGSCWAFSATEALSDRLCIASSSSINVILSPQDLVSCDDSDSGCNGGYLQSAWQFMADSGVVLDTCMPYTSGQGDSGECPGQSCTGSGDWTPYYAVDGTIQTMTDVQTIQTEIMTNGPVQASFSVYQDFFSYSGGVYQHQSGSLDGGHAIKIIGWGSENGTPYWLVANSWGTSWGLSGFFKILRGQDECGIESNVVAGQAKVN